MWKIIFPDLQTFFYYRISNKKTKFLCSAWTLLIQNVNWPLVLNIFETHKHIILSIYTGAELNPEQKPPIKTTHAETKPRFGKIRRNFAQFFLNSQIQHGRQLTRDLVQKCGKLQNGLHRLGHHCSDWFSHQSSGFTATRFADGASVAANTNIGRQNLRRQVFLEPRGESVAFGAEILGAQTFANWRRRLEK